MADSSQVVSGLSALTEENWSSTIVDTLFDAMPFLQLAIGKNGGKNAFNGLGVPNSGLLVSGMKGALMKKKEILAGTAYMPNIHHLLPAEGDGKVMGMRDNTPVREDWANQSPAKRFKRPVFKWTELMDPCKVPAKDMRRTARNAAGERNGWQAIGDLMNVERNDVLGVHMRRWDQLFHGSYTGASGASTTGAPTDETAEVWDAPHSIYNALRTDNTYGGVDRTVSANAFWQGNNVTAATAFNPRDMIRAANYTTGSTELAKKGGYGGIDCILCNGTLFSIALSQADALKGTIVLANTPIPDFGQFGFKRDMIRIDNTWIVYDPTMPAGKAAGLNLKTWTVAIHPDANFKQSSPEYQGKIEGGDDAYTWNLRTELMIVCEAPSLNVWWNSVS
jgi:hypothetical protein